MVDLYTSMDVQTTETIAEGWRLLTEFGKLLEV